MLRNLRPNLHWLASPSHGRRRMGRHDETGWHRGWSACVCAAAGRSATRCTPARQLQLRCTRQLRCTAERTGRQPPQLHQPRAAPGTYGQAAEAREHGGACEAAKPVSAAQQDRAPRPTLPSSHPPPARTSDSQLWLVAVHLFRCVRSARRWRTTTTSGC